MKNVWNWGIILIVLLFIFYIIWICESARRAMNNRQSLNNIILLRDYQLDINIDSTAIWDGDRKVGTIYNNWNTSLDSLIMKDNE